MGKKKERGQNLQRRQISKRDLGEVTGLEGPKCGKEQMEVLETAVNGWNREERESPGRKLVKEEEWDVWDKEIKSE